MYKIRSFFNIDILHKKGILGDGVTVAVLDSGAYPHTDFKNRIIEFRDYINHRPEPYDDHSHGTHICGIICGGGKNNKRYTGMAPGSEIIPVKVLDNTGHGDSDIIIPAINWILSNRKIYNIRIVNISIGTKSSDCSEENSDLVRAVDTMWDEGIIVLVSAGNNGPDYRSITIPGISRKVITVGSCGWNNSSSTSSSRFSGKGPTHCNIPKPDIVVPGDNIISCSTNDGYTAKSGTSMSTPVVSGAAALILSRYPEITNSEFKKLLLKSASDIGLDRYTQGHGMLNLQKLFAIIN